MGLLEYLTSHTLDEDYAVVAASRPDSTAHRRGGAPRAEAGWIAAVVIAVFAVLVVTAGVQTTRNAGSDAAQRRDLIDQVEQARSALDHDREQSQTLRSESASLRQALLNGNQRAVGQNKQLRGLEAAAGTGAVHGPGIEVVVDDAANSDNERAKVLDVDLQRLANGLWAAGAEAIAINGQRLTTLSSIRHAGDAITVNFRSLKRPYTVQAIGDPQALPAKFADTPGGQGWIALHQEFGIRFDMVHRESLSLPAQPKPHLRFATSPTNSTPTPRTPEGNRTQ